MNKQTKKHLGGCPVAYGTDIFGDRWTLLVIRDMIFHGKKRYGDLLDAEEKIATNILADRLAHLEAAGVVNKAQDPENRRSYIYSLTQKGLALTPIILEIVRWSGSHLKMNKSRRELLKRIDTDRNNLIAEIYAHENISLPKLAI